MKKIKIFSTLGVGLLLSLLFACSESFLETVPTGSANDVILANEKGVQMLLISAYAALDGAPRGQDGSGLPGSVSNWVFGGFASDDAYKGQGQTGEATSNVIESYTADASTPYLQGRWYVDYDAISRANDVLKIMEKVKGISDANQKSYKAQALFIRGFMHFEAKRVFNNIPYITEKDDATKVSNTIDAWPGIENDLKFAVENLPAKQTDVGRPTKYAAEAVLAKVYMFQKKWTDAKPLLDDIIASGKYVLMPNFEDNFLIAKRNNLESVFEIQYSIFDGEPNQANAGYGQYAVNGMIGVDGLSSCCGGYQPSQNLVNAFQVDPGTGLPFLDLDTLKNLKNDMNIISTTYFEQDTLTPVDPRLDYTVGRRGIPFLDIGIMRGYSWIREQAYGGPYVNRKYQFKKSDVGINSNTQGWATGLNINNYRAVRYAHVLLLRAEVAAETGDLAKATELVNMIRNRAANNVVMGRCRTFILPSQSGLNVDYSVPAANYLIKPYPATFATLDVARKAIRMETRLELAMEGFRFFDLVRWGIAGKAINIFIKQDINFRSYLGGVSPAVFTIGKNEYWPIPQTQMDLQPGVLVQNTGF